MIRALLLATGLLTGPLQVGVDIASPVDSPPHAVEIYLDGQSVAEMTEAPWEVWIDLGDELRPRDLAVVSRDASGAEIDRAARRLNQYLPREAAERDATPITVLLDGPLGGSGDMEGFFEVDGEPAEVADVTYPDAEFWVVRDPLAQRRLDYAAALVVGGYHYGTPLDGETLRAGPEPTQKLLMGNSDFVSENAGRFPSLWETLQRLYTFEDGTTMRLVSPLGAPVSQIENPLKIFSSTAALDGNFRGLLFHTYAHEALTRWRRLADAVGLAGLESTAHARRRAVVLLTAELDLPDDSLYEVAEIRRYLQRLGVPLLVWSTHLEATAEDPYWGTVRSIYPQPAGEEVPEDEPGGGYLRPLNAAVHELDQTLRRQRIVWIRGRHLPTDVRLSAQARGVQLLTSGAVAGGDS